MSLPTNVVVDLTTWGNTFQERSQFPQGVINPFTGYVDILVYPNGSVVPTTIYSTPSSFGMSGAFYHFWLAERSDVRGIHLDNNNNPVPIVTGQPVYLPVGNIKQQLVLGGTPYTGPSLQGEYRIVTLFTRTGQVTTNDNVQFDNPVNPANGTTYNPNFPFLATEQGTREEGPDHDGSSEAIRSASVRRFCDGDRRDRPRLASPSKGGEVSPSFARESSDPSTLVRCFAGGSR